MNTHWTIRDLRRALAAGTLQASALAETALACANQNAGRNTYIWQDAAWTLAEAARAAAMPRGSGGPFGDGRPALWGVPISVKDLFDLAGSPTSCGTHFYRDSNGIATRDSWLVEQLRAAGAVIIGKTHLHALAFGITGQNPDYGDCVQPADPGAFTGGSSSGAAASVQEGSAVAAIGTDTGGSIRVPAALCGLAGYRATLGRGDWRGAAHLAECFDTMGWFFRDLEDAPLLAAPFAPAAPAQASRFTRFAFIDGSFLKDCESQIVDSLRSVVRTLQALGLEGRPIDPDWWEEAAEIFPPLQASEAAQVHAGNFDRFEPAIRDRLRWGAGMTSDEITALRRRHSAFRVRMDELFSTHDLILLPSASVTRLAVGVDHSQTRSRLLRYRAPFSLAGVPTVVIPCKHGGIQLAAARGCDESLLQLAAQLGAHRKLAAVSQDQGVAGQVRSHSSSRTFSRIPTKQT
jgi:aspartyl-tRNA(Asn)/glutamyl-tRNA(Gln) amidotransferase subunit A